MDANQIYLLFRNSIPIPEEEIINWYPIGQSTICIHLSSGYSFVFTVGENKKWLLAPNNGRW